jgi:hypothetical protein
MAAKATSKSVWENLSKIDVSEHTEEKGGLTYLSWAWAWGILKEQYPEASYVFREFECDGRVIDYMPYPDGTGSVHCTVAIGDDIHSSMWLPVMDYRNKAISNPDARAVSDAKMRCLVKNLAMLGLGHYIYAGEDIPSQESSTASNSKPVAKKKKPEPKDDQEEESGIQVGYEVFVETIESLDDLTKFWKANQKELQKLKHEHPKKYDAIIEVFAKRKGELS